MSDSDEPVREWRFYLDDMIGFAEKVLAYTIKHTLGKIVAKTGTSPS
jgi:uncharacterized protein with HEPN domain